MLLSRFSQAQSAGNAAPDHFVKDILVRLLDVIYRRTDALDHGSQVVVFSAQPLNNICHDNISQKYTAQSVTATIVAA